MAVVAVGASLAVTVAGLAGVPSPATSPVTGLATAGGSVDQALAVAGPAPPAFAFEPNVGQTNRRAIFVARGPKFTLFLTRTGARMSLDGGQHRGALDMRLLGTDARVAGHGEHRLGNDVNYLRGSDPAGWQSDVPTFASVRQPGVYEGIDLVWHSAKGALEYDFEVAPGADPSRIALRMGGADSLLVDDSGALVADVAGHRLVQRAPVAFQIRDGRRQSVPTRFVLDGARVSFAVAEHDPTRTLVIDPEIDYGTYLGGSSEDGARDMVIDSAGAAYVTGATRSLDFPTTTGVVDTSANGRFDAYVAKLSPDGSQLEWATYLGGSMADQAFGLGLDAAGSVYVAGTTESTDLPTTPGALDREPDAGGFEDAFVAKLSADGSQLLYSTYLGEGGRDTAEDLMVDASGAAYVTGSAQGYVGTCESHPPTTDQFPTTPGAFETDPGCGREYDGYVAKLTPDGSALTYSTYIGGRPQPSFGDANDSPQAITVDATGAAYVTGTTDSTTFRTTDGAYQRTVGGRLDAFVTKLLPDGSGLAYSTLLGGSEIDSARGIAVDDSGAAYVTGRAVAGAVPFPTTPGAFDTSPGPVDREDVFVTKLRPDGSDLAYSTFLAGRDNDSGHAVAIGPDGSVFVTGESVTSNTAVGTDFPVTPDAFDSTGSGQDAFLTQVNADGSGLVYSSLFGGASFNLDTGKAAAEEGRALAVDGTDVYVAGITGAERQFPTTPGAYDTVLGSGSDGFGDAQDAFLMKFSMVPAVPSATTTTLACEPDSVGVGEPSSCTVTVSDTGVSPRGTPTGTVPVTSDSAGSFSGTCDLAPTTTPNTGTCKVTYLPTAVGVHRLTAEYAGDTAHEPSSGHATVSILDTTAPTVTIETPRDGATYQQFQVVTARYTCSDDTALKSCNGPVANGRATDTTRGGPQTFAVTATDAADNTTTETVDYHVRPATLVIYLPWLPAPSCFKLGASIRICLAPPPSL